MRRELAIAMVFLLTLSLALSTISLAQDSAPNWPPEWFGSSLDFPPIPPGQYPVTVLLPGIGGSTIGDTLVIGPSCSGAFCLSSGPHGVFGTTVGCTDSTCQVLNIFVVTCDPPDCMNTTYFTIQLRWSDYVAVIMPTPRASSTPNSPTPTTPVPPTTTPVPTQCPADVIQQLPPRVSQINAFPPNPVVRGQGGQGLTITYRVTSYPVVRHWWKLVDNSRDACVHIDANGNIDGEYTGQYPVNPCDAQWEDWEVRHIDDKKCEEQIEIIPDPIRADTFVAHARLRENSKRWILGELQQRYPGARIRKPNWDVNGQVQSNGCSPDGICTLVITVHFPFEDPGWYDIRAEGQTAGTQYTPPRTFQYQPSRPQPVYLMDSTLLPEW